MSDSSQDDPQSACPLVVLDTNVVLDLWLFDDPRASPLRASLASGALAALVTAPMLSELVDVLGRPFASAWPATPALVLEQLRGCSQLVGEHGRGGTPAPRCTDQDDQKFIDLAWSWPAQWLISRDRAVLKLARPALARGVRIATPERWAATVA